MKDNDVWKEEFIDRLVLFSSSIVMLSTKLPKTPTGFALANQIVRSGTSVGANFIEAQDAWYWLKVIERTRLLAYDDIRNEIDECNQIRAVLIRSIKKSKSKLI